jgi:deoxycytidylate deaminase
MLLSMALPFEPPAFVDHPELFFALVGPSGTDMNTVVDALEAELCVVDYSLDRGEKLSELLHALEPHEALKTFAGYEDERIAKHMDGGDDVRRQLQHGGALAALAINSVRERRAGDEPKARTAYLFRSLKHPNEIDVLRSVYESALTVISIYEPEETRCRRLAQKIQKSGRAESEAFERARSLIERDQHGGGSDGFGQSVRKAFPLADFFLDASRDIRGQLARLVQLLFRHPCRSPTRDEHAMFMARATALRSADLSRQVGAVVANHEGEVMSAGCNEVPRPGGGVYWDGDEPDLRDYKQGTDPNALMGHELLVEVLAVLQQEGWLIETRTNASARDLADEAHRLDIFEHARVSNLIEFGRVVHAEMNAVAQAALRGIAVSGQRLYCTTFPCHVCARHLLGAGLSEVVYIEPYPKSLALDLYPEAIVLGDRPQKDRLVFRPFTGVAPARYLEFFDFGRRKDKQGYAEEWDPKRARPRVRRVGNPHLLVERDLCNRLREALAERGWV